MIGRHLTATKRVIIIALVVVFVIAVVHKYYNQPHSDLMTFSGLKSQTGTIEDNHVQGKVFKGTLKELHSIYDQKLFHKAPIPEETAALKPDNAISKQHKFGSTSQERSLSQTLNHSMPDAPLGRNYDTSHVQLISESTGQTGDVGPTSQGYVGPSAMPAGNGQDDGIAEPQAHISDVHDNLINHHINSMNRSGQLNHFADFPRPWSKPPCPQRVQIDEPEFSAIIYLTGRVDSFTAQTVLALLDFSAEASLVLKDLIFAYGTGDERLPNPEMDGTIDYLARIVNGRVGTKTVWGNYEWEAKTKGTELATAKKVLIVDDTLIINRDSLAYLLYCVEVQPFSLHYPHIDSMLPIRIYGSSSNGQFHPDDLIWQETSLNLYKITTQFIYKRYDRGNVREDSTSTDIQSAALTGEAFVATREHLLNLFSLLQTDSPAELSVLAWMCGEGIRATKCSVAVKSNNYEKVVPTLPVGAKSIIEELYPVDNFGRQPWRKVQAARKQLGCKESKWYFMELSKTMDIPVNKPANQS